MCSKLSYETCTKDDLIVNHDTLVMVSYTRISSSNYYSYELVGVIRSAMSALGVGYQVRHPRAQAGEGPKSKYTKTPGIVH
jgi:hypothetical protein